MPDERLMRAGGAVFVSGVLGIVATDVLRVSSYVIGLVLVGVVISGLLLIIVGGVVEEGAPPVVYVRRPTPWGSVGPGFARFCSNCGSPLARPAAAGRARCPECEATPR